MKDLTKKQLIWLIVKWVLFAALITATIILLVNHDATMRTLEGVKDPVDDTIWIKEPLYLSIAENETIKRWIYQYAFKGLYLTVEIVGVSVFLAVALHYAAMIPFASKKARTISKLLLNFIKWCVFIAAIFLTMAAWGANSVALLTSAGVLTLIIGLGSQSLVADILAGVFIVFEGDFQVGDIVIIDGWRGEVQEIGIRTTKLIDAGYNVKIVNNSDIRSIVNQTTELSLAKCYVSIEYGTRIEKVEAVIKDNLAKLKEQTAGVVEGPYYKGVAELGESSVVLLFVAKCKEDDIYQVQRDLNRNVKIMFDDNGINIPFNQIVVNFADKNKEEEKPTKSEIKKSEKLNKEQKELSKDVDITNENN